MEKTYFADNVIMTKRIWDVAKILDFCVLFGPKSRDKVREVVERLFSVQPKLAEELARAVPGIDKALESAMSRISESVCSTLFPLYCLHVPILIFIQEVPPSYSEIVDIGSYLLDTTKTVLALLTVYPPASHAFASCPPFLKRLSYIYEYPF